MQPRPAGLARCYSMWITAQCHSGSSRSPSCKRTSSVAVCKIVPGCSFGAWSKNFPEIATGATRPSGKMETAQAGTPEAPGLEWMLR